jgi:hypothetical protein
VSFSAQELLEIYHQIPKEERERVEALVRSRLEPALRSALEAKGLGQGKAPSGPVALPGWEGQLQQVRGGATAAPAVFLRDDPQALPGGKPATSVGLAGPDLDGDGLPDDFEASVANLFTPVYFVSAGERAGTGFANFGDFVPQTVTQSFGSLPPRSHFRVTPVGFAVDNTGTTFGFLEIDYLTLWNRDDGLSIGGDCRFLVSILAGITGLGALTVVDIVDQGHVLDNERSAVLVATPAVGGAFSSDPFAYRIYSFYTAGHEGTFFDTSVFGFVDPPLPAGNHLLLALSRSKHATYTFNPNFLPLFPPDIIVLTNLILSDLYFFGFIDFDTFLFYTAVADTVFFSCVVERFSDQGGQFAATAVNVGELSRPLNGSGFINDPNGLQGKLARLLWRIQ